MQNRKTEGCVDRKHPARPGRPDRPVLFAIIASLTLSACATGPAPPAAVAIAPVQVDVNQLPDDYGLASYHRLEDRERTIEQAKIA